MPINLSDVVLSINTTVLCFVCVDYIKFRINFHENMKNNFVQRDICNITVENTSKTLEEIKRKLDEIEIKIDELKAEKKK